MSGSPEKREMDEAPQIAGLADEGATEKRAAKKGFFPSSMGLSFLVSEKTKELEELRQEWNAELIDPIFLGLIHSAGWKNKLKKKK